MNKMRIKSNNLVLVRGVFLKDLQTVKKVTAQLENIYCEIPARFTKVDDWPLSTNLSCWNCSLKFNEYPKFIPQNIEVDISCDVYGVFCRWGCVNAYILTNYSLSEKHTLLLNMILIAKLFLGERAHYIRPSPPKTVMRKYCGNSGITPEEYREQIAL